MSYMQNAIYYAYFAPYSYERHQDLIAKVIGHKRVQYQVLGETLDGHDIDFLQIGKTHTSVVLCVSTSLPHAMSAPLLRSSTTVLFMENTTGTVCSQLCLSTMMQDLWLLLCCTAVAEVSMVCDRRL